MDDKKLTIIKIKDIPNEEHDELFKIHIQTQVKTYGSKKKMN
jgi:hypothetical protein